MSSNVFTVDVNISLYPFQHLDRYRKEFLEAINRFGYKSGTEISSAEWLNWENNELPCVYKDFLFIFPDKLPLGDALYCESFYNYLFVSAKVKNILDKYNMEGIRTYPLKYKSKGKIYEDSYYIVYIPFDSSHLVDFQETSVIDDQNKKITSYQGMIQGYQNFIKEQKGRPKYNDESDLYMKEPSSDLFTIMRFFSRTILIKPELKAELEANTFGLHFNHRPQIHFI
jgi:hypothetical protein